MNKLQQLLLTILLISSQQSISSEKFCHVTKIIDGDTIWVVCGNTKEKVRLTNIDSFENKRNNRAFRQAYQQKITINEVVRRGKLATKYTTQELLNRDVLIKVNESTPKDLYGRTLGEIDFDGVNMNQKLLQKYPKVFLKY